MTHAISIHVIDPKSKRIAKLLMAVAEYLDESGIDGKKSTLDVGLDIDVKKVKK